MIVRVTATLRLSLLESRELTEDYARGVWEEALGDADWVLEDVEDSRIGEVLEVVLERQPEESDEIEGQREQERKDARAAERAIEEARVSREIGERSAHRTRKDGATS